MTILAIILASWFSAKAYGWYESLFDGLYVINLNYKLTLI